jgi:rfaE bifunctional protein nucleotidyltransferase chain/domain
LTDFFHDFDELKNNLEKWRNKKLKIVFTNGCFDILHRGHVEYLSKAKSYGDILIVGLNSDTSVKRLKGESRPYINEDDRGYILSNLKAVDAVVLFNEDTPYKIINKIIPDVLVKGGDYKLEEIVGRETVEKNGGKVETVGFIKGNSTSILIEKIRNS